MYSVPSAPSQWAVLPIKTCPCMFASASAESANQETKYKELDGITSARVQSGWTSDASSTDVGDIQRQIGGDRGRRLESDAASPQTITRMPFSGVR